MADNINMKDFDGDPVVLRATDKGTAFVPHHIQDAVALQPVTSSGVALTDKLLASAVAASLVNMDVYVDQDGYLVLLDISGAPSVGAIVPLKIWKVYADTTFSYTPPNPLKCLNGVTIAFVATIAAAFTYASGGNHIFVSAEVAAVTGEAS